MLTFDQKLKLKQAKAIGQKVKIKKWHLENKTDELRILKNRQAAMRHRNKKRNGPATIVGNGRPPTPLSVDQPLIHSI